MIGDHKCVQEARNELNRRYTKSRYVPPKDDWPPYHPTHYTPLTIVHHEGERTESEVLSMAECMAHGSKSGKATRNISDLFTPFDETASSYFLLIEGAPGIGKTILSKEIALQWAEDKVLTNKKLLFVLFMRDPGVKSIIDIPSLVKYFNLNAEITAWLNETSGKHLTVLLDGYDEASEDDFIINRVVGREVLTECGLIITSRPVASSHFHERVNCRVEVLGFTEEDRLNFIQTALQNNTDEVEKLKNFFKTNPFLNALCYIPLNMSILLCLAKKGIDTLPRTQTKLYKKFIVMTIVHFLKRLKNIEIATVEITELNNLPSPYDQVVKEIAHFAFLALQKGKLVFTRAEVTAACPNVTLDNWYGLGLLKPVHYFEPDNACDHESFHFLHFAIQEYMAAYYIASLKDSEQLNLLYDTFWEVHYINTWVMYSGIVDDDQVALKRFVCGSHSFLNISNPSKISSAILKDKIKCLHLLHCLKESRNTKMLSSVEGIFEKGVIDLSNRYLSPNDIDSLAVVISKLHKKEWEELNLSKCNVDDKNCAIILDVFSTKRETLTIKSVDISFNELHWESLETFCDIMRLWQTKELVVSPDSLSSTATSAKINQSIYDLTNAAKTARYKGQNSDDTLLVTYISNDMV